MNLRNPDETKKMLADPIPVHYHPGDLEPRLTPLMMVDLEELHADALALIQQLEAENAELSGKIGRLQAERDAAVACIPRECGYCKHDGTADFDVDSVCDYCLNGNTRWEWRGVTKEE